MARRAAEQPPQPQWHLFPVADHDDSQRAASGCVRAVIAPTPELDVAASGAVLELIDSADRSLYRGELPGPAFGANPSRRVFRFLDGPAWAPLPQANGLGKLIFRRKSKRMIVVVKAAASELAEALAESTLTWVIRSGDACMSAPRLTCSRASRDSVRCR